MCDLAPGDALAWEGDVSAPAAPRGRILQPEAREHRGVVASLDPRLRLLASFAFAIAVVTLDRLAPLILALALAVVAAPLGGMSARRLLRALLALDSSMAFVVATLPFTTAGAPLGSVLGFPASAEGLARAIVIALKANAITLMALALLGSSELPEIGHALRRLGVPAKLTQLLLMTVRYVEVLGDEYRRLRTAMTLRGFRMRFSVHVWRSVGHLFGMLFVRSLERAERIGAAMRCRGFNGEFPALAEFAYGPRDAAFAAGALTLLIVIRFV
jgi:cobalt/nickel transport system permease protein